MASEEEKNKKRITLKRIQLRNLSPQEIIEKKASYRARRIRIKELDDKITKSIQEAKDGLAEAKELHKKVFG